MGGGDPALTHAKGACVAYRSESRRHPARCHLPAAIGANRHLELRDPDAVAGRGRGAFRAGGPDARSRTPRGGMSRALQTAKAGRPY